MGLVIRLGFLYCEEYVLMFVFIIVVFVGSLCKDFCNCKLVYVLEKFVGDCVCF